MKRSRWTVVILAGVATAVACSDFDASEESPSRDGGSDAVTSGNLADAASVLDASDDNDIVQAQCNPRGPFPRVELLVAMKSELQEVHPSLTADGREIFFSRFDPSNGHSHAYTASRASLGAPFDDATEMSELAAGTDIETLPSVSPDGLRLAYSVLRNGSGTYELMMATRANRVEKFLPSAATVANLNVGSTRAPAFGPGRRLYFSSNRNGVENNNDKLYAADPTVEGYANAKPIVDDNNNHVLGVNPVPSADGSVLIFARYTAEKKVRLLIADLDDSGTRIQNIGYLTDVPDNALAGAGETFEGAGYLSEDNCRLYFHAGPFSSLDSDLYVASQR